jgi:transcriptional regulator with XRE-family HTH domain
LIGPRQTGVMDDQRLGAAVRLIRIRRHWRQRDLAAAARVSTSTVSRLERGHLGSLSVDAVRRIAAVLDIRVDLLGRWRAGDLDRLLNARHSALHEAVARTFRADLPDWTIRPEVSFSIYGERGIVDVVAWHPARRALLIIELKTDIVDVNDLVGGVDRKRRLAGRIAAELGYQPLTVSTWVVVAPGRTNRRRIAVHGAMLRAAFPVDGRGVRRWLGDPDRAIDALALWPESHAQTVRSDPAPVRRVRRASEAAS